MTTFSDSIARYASEVAELARSETTTEPTYYPAVRSLLDDVLRAGGLPFGVRTNTSEARRGGGRDLPDVAFYDGSGDYVVVCGEVKTPDAALEDLAESTERNDQVGRYLAQTNAVLLCNVRAFGLLTTSPEWSGDGPVPPEHRRLEHVVELWPSPRQMAQGAKCLDPDGVELAALVETAVTRYAPIAEPESLARILARQARRAKADLPDAFSKAVHDLLEDFGDALGITFEGPEGEEFFRSSLIQTAFYALFSGWVLWHDSDTDEPFDWEDLGEYLRIPFLGELFYEFRHPARIRELKLARHLDIATETLLRVDTERFFERFQTAMLNGDADDEGVPTAPIVYFYEPFLEAFDPGLRKELGVWYTPSEIVRYQVEKIDRLLREEMGCSRGFADERVVVLDPCCGTGAYLIEVMRAIAGQLRREGEDALLGARLLEAFSKRVIGFEILTAPFVIAQLQIYLILGRLGAVAEEKQRPAIFLTNALTGWDEEDQPSLHFPELQEEHELAHEVKTEREIIVILGNPPYNRFAGVPMEEEAELVDHYKGIRRDESGRQVGNTDLYEKWGIRKHLLDDLYIRFFRLAERQIGEQAPHGVVSFISNYSYLDGRSHPIMRESLLHNFHTVWVDCLNGDKYRTGKVIPEGLPGEGSSDQSVFTTEYDPRGIQVGTSITTLAKTPDGDGDVAEAFFRDFWGRSDAKRGALLESLEEHTEEEREAAAARPEGPREYRKLEPTQGNAWKLVPYEVVGGYEDWAPLDELFPTSFQGVNPNRGVQGSVIDTDPDRLKARMRDYFSYVSFEDLKERYPELCKKRARYEPADIRETLRETSEFDPDRIVPYVMFPLDVRWVYYEDKAKLLNERRPELWENVDDNEFLIAVPQPRQRSEALPLFATGLFDLHLHDRGSVGFPALVNSPDDLLAAASEPRVGNLAPGVAERLAAAWGFEKVSEELKRQFCRELFRAALAICHAPQYLAENGDALGQDWARIPVPASRDVFDDLVDLGGTLAQLLDPMQDAAAAIERFLGDERTDLGRVESGDGSTVSAEDLVVTYSYFAAGKGRWENRLPRPKEPFHDAWGDGSGDLYLNEDVYLRHVPEAVWSYQLGGYPVIKKWLGYRDAKRRDGEPLTLSEVGHLREMVQRIAAILILHSRLDDAYEAAAEDALRLEELQLEEGWS